MNCREATYRARFNSRSHRICGIPTAARSCTGAGMPHDFLPFPFVDVPGEKLTIALERRDDVELLAAPMAGSNGSSIDHQRWPVEPSHGDNAARHVFVTPRDRDIRV